ncbi:ornithine cyclodeaminase family protein [Allorhizobium taibaishanense]|uniref:Ornithine cyclodeaminase n=1 Tax=Allorhizobium taibaishanense TaxID=887144 RepID=A0A1Q9A7R8_9HYPH|nr:ornithine cyclodeaminase family protein [Allorhizobium taibaishanense]MBB4008177.1 ornithine cyclodeaminase/alanine dehydrogenase [Allorhizobium taibaishanense]OLP50613.1 ornithine cyclodeaminase [Allorhizobium taibaishanense]
MSDALASASHHSTLFLGTDDLAQVFSWDKAIEALKSAYAADCTEVMFPPRSMARGNGFWLRTLTGITPTGGVMGAKMIAANTRNKRASYLIPLFDQESVELLSLIDGNSITGYRTAATTALALDALAPAGPVSVGILGTGFEARNHLKALAAVRNISSVRVFSPNPDSRAKFKTEMAPLALEITGDATARDVVQSAPDILICAARSRDEQPLFEGAWLSPGMTVASIGSTLPEQREVDPDTIARANLIVADMAEEVAHDTGDMKAASQAGISFEKKLIPLADLIAGRHPGRTSPEDIVLFKSVGSALQDLAVAAMCFGRARELGLGTPLPQTIHPVLK